MTRDENTKVVPFERSRRVPDAARVAEFAATARRLQRERDRSAELVACALTETPREQWTSLAARPELLNSGVLERLSTLADELENDPQQGLAISELATAIAEAVRDDEYPRIVVAQLRAHAWKDRARALCYVAMYDEAARALDRADAALLPFGTLAHDQAVVAFVRSIVLQHLRRFDEAQSLLEHCRNVFNDHGDVRLVRKCSMATANLLVRRGDYRAAREELAELVRSGDAEAIARARFALGWCAIHLGDADEALVQFRDAERRNRQLGCGIEAVRATYGIGCALLRLGRVDAAIERLSAARGHFLEHALVEEAGLSGLELVEARMLRAEADAASELAASIVQEFAAARLSRRAVAAVAYLNEAIAASRATAETVRDVHAYITALRSDPTRDFTAATN